MEWITCCVDAPSGGHPVGSGTLFIARPSIHLFITLAHMSTSIGQQHWVSLLAASLHSINHMAVHILAHTRSLAGVVASHPHLHAHHLVNLLFMYFWSAYSQTNSQGTKRPWISQSRRRRAK